MARARRVKRERADVALVLSQFTPPEAGQITVTLTRCAPHKIDSDGAVHAMKGVRDQVAAWLGLDDDDPRITWTVERKKCGRKEQGTVIRVESHRPQSARGERGRVEA